MGVDELVAVVGSGSARRSVRLVGGGAGGMVTYWGLVGYLGLAAQLPVSEGTGCNVSMLVRVPRC